VVLEPLNEADTTNLTQRLREEALANRGVVIAPMMIGAFARKLSAS